MDEALLDIRGLSVTYAGDRESVPAVRGINLKVLPGEIMALVGESGCGKSSVALAVMGLVNERRVTVNGFVGLDGRDLLALRERERRAIRGRDLAMIFQNPMSSLNPYLRVGFQVAEPLMVHQGWRRRRALLEADSLLDSVGIQDARVRAHSYPHEFSGGMCQRVMVASALAGKPKLLIADEPTTALDVITQHQVLSLLRSLRKQYGMAILLITHDLGIVANFCDRAAVMLAGQIVEQGPVAELFDRPRHEYTRRLLEAVPRIDRPRSRRLAGTGLDSNGTAGRAAGPVWISPPAVLPSPTSTVVRDERPLVELRDVSVTFPGSAGLLGSRPGRVHAVDGVTLDVRRGEVLGLVGQSGSGKTTLIRALLGLVPVSSGRVMLDGRDITDLGRAARRNVWRDMQVVFQDPFSSLNARMTAGAIIADPLVNYRLGSAAQRRARVSELMELVRLDPSWVNRFPHEFSGGQRQRIGIARALALNPRILLCDEPVSSLDVSIQAEIINLLQDLRQRLRLTLVFVSHDLAVVRHIADRVAVMQRGRLVEVLASDGIPGGATHPYTRELLSAIPVLQVQGSPALAGGGNAG